MTPSEKFGEFEVEIDTRELLNRTGKFDITIKAHVKRYWLVHLGLKVMIFGAWIIGVNGSKVRTHLELEEL